MSTERNPVNVAKFNLLFSAYDGRDQISVLLSTWKHKKWPVDPSMIIYTSQGVMGWHWHTEERNPNQKKKEKQASLKSEQAIRFNCFDLYNFFILKEWEWKGKKCGENIYGYCCTLSIFDDICVCSMF